MWVSCTSCVLCLERVCCIVNSVVVALLVDVTTLDTVIDSCDGECDMWPRGGGCNFVSTKKRIYWHEVENGVENQVKFVILPAFT